MQKPQKYVSTLRCQTFNIWPEKNQIIYDDFKVEYGDRKSFKAKLSIKSYLNRTPPELYENKETQYGSLLWDGSLEGLYRVGEKCVAAVGQRVQLKPKYRKSYCGEIDIEIHFTFPSLVPPIVTDALYSSTLAIISLLNLALGDYITPTMPFILSKENSAGGRCKAYEHLVKAQKNQRIKIKRLETELLNVTKTLLSSHYSGKLRTALELYASHFQEKQVKVRFLLLVMALESLAESTNKHKVAIDVVQNWQIELVDTMLEYEESSDEYKALKAMKMEIGSYSKKDSIRSQIRNLFLGLTNTSPLESTLLQKKAVKVYDGRSKLVHEGFLPTDKLYLLEIEAKELLEKLLISELHLTK